MKIAQWFLTIAFYFGLIYFIGLSGVDIAISVITLFGSIGGLLFLIIIFIVLVIIFPYVLTTSKHFLGFFIKLEEEVVEEVIEIKTNRNRQTQIDNLLK